MQYLYPLRMPYARYFYLFPFYDFTVNHSSFDLLSFLCKIPEWRVVYHLNSVYKYGCLIFVCA